MSQRGLRDANDVVSIEVLKPDTCQLPIQVRDIWIDSFMRTTNKVQHPTVWISEGLGVSEGDVSPVRYEVLANLIVGSIPIAINGGLSHFRPGHSTIAQRAWTMTWLAFGLFFGCSVGLLGPMMAERFFSYNVYFVPAIGGFVVVAQMLMSYGSCMKIGEANI